MNAAPHSQERWTRQRWAVVIFFASALQVGAVYFLSGSTSATPVKPGPTFATAMITSRELNDSILDRLFASDPTLLVMANRHGFSGSPWVNYPLPDHAPPDWSEPEPWLSPPVAMLAKTFTEYVSTNAAAPARMAERLPPEIPLVFVPPQILPKESTLRIEGELANRGLALSPRLPVWPHTNLLSESVVQVLVDAKGRARSAALVSTGPSKDPLQAEADKFALSWAMTNRYQSAPAGTTASTMISGRLVFEWYTPPPRNTNPLRGN
jgi:hypothetical protein